MAERRVSQVVAQANRLDQVAVEAQGTADIAGNARDELHMKAAPRQIVIAAKTEDLCFAGIASVRRKMKNLFGIAHKRRTHKRAFVGGAINTTNDLIVVATIRVNIARSTIGGNALEKFGRQRRGNAVHARLNDGRFLISCHGMLLKKDAQSVTMCSPRPRLWQISAQKREQWQGARFCEEAGEGQTRSATANATMPPEGRACKARRAPWHPHADAGGLANTTPERLSEHESKIHDDSKTCVVKRCVQTEIEPNTR